MMLPKKKIYKDEANYRRYALNSELCEVCGCLAQDCHHIVFRSQGRDDRDSNLIALCRNHHELAHGKEAKLWRKKFLEIKEQF